MALRLSGRAPPDGTTLAAAGEEFELSSGEFELIIPTDAERLLGGVAEVRVGGSVVQVERLPVTATPAFTALNEAFRATLTLSVPRPASMRYREAGAADWINHPTTFADGTNYTIEVGSLAAATYETQWIGTDGSFRSDIARGLVLGEAAAITRLLYPGGLPAVSTREHHSVIIAAFGGRPHAFTNLGGQSWRAETFENGNPERLLVDVRPIPGSGFQTNFGLTHGLTGDIATCYVRRVDDKTPLLSPSPTQSATPGTANFTFSTPPPAGVYELVTVGTATMNLDASSDLPPEDPARLVYPFGLPPPGGHAGGAAIIAAELRALHLFVNVDQASWRAETSDPSTGEQIVIDVRAIPTDGTATAFSVVHGLTGTIAGCHIRRVDTKEEIATPAPAQDAGSPGTATFTFPTAPAAGIYELVTYGVES